MGRYDEFSYEHTDVEIPEKKYSSGDIKWNLNLQV